MKRPLRTGDPLRVTSVTSITPREVLTSTRRPARVASISYVSTPAPESTTTSILSPFTIRAYPSRPTRASAAGPRVPADRLPRMYLDAFSDNSFETNCWLLGADGTQDAVVVDPGFSPERVRALLEAESRRPVAVFATHGHYDHIGAAAEFCGDDMPFYIHEADVVALTDPEGWGSGARTPPVPVKDVRTMVDGNVLTFAGFRIEVMHTPGHTPGSVCFLTDAIVLSGDLVFAGSVGRSDFANSSPADMARSLNRFLEQPDPTEVLPGHGPRTTIGRERERNPFLRER